MASQTSSPIQPHRQSRFLEDEAVGGKAPTQRDCDQTTDNELPVYSRVVRYLSSFNPLNALRPRPKSTEQVHQAAKANPISCSTSDTSNPPTTPTSPTPTSPTEAKSRDHFCSDSEWSPPDQTPRRYQASKSVASHDDDVDHRGKKLRRHSLASLRKTPSTMSLKARSQIHHASQSLKRRFSTDSLKRHEKQHRKLENRISHLEQQLTEAHSQLRAWHAPDRDIGPAPPRSLEKTPSWPTKGQAKKSPKWRSPKPRSPSFNYTPQPDPPLSPGQLPSKMEWLRARSRRRIPFGETYEQFWGIPACESPSRKRKDAPPPELGPHPSKRRRIDWGTASVVLAGASSPDVEEIEEIGRPQALGVIEEEEAAWGWPEDCF